MAKNDKAAPGVEPAPADLTDEQRAAAPELSQDGDDEPNVEGQAGAGSAAALPPGFVRLRHVSDPKASATVAGATYEPDADGLVVAHQSAVDALAAHGFQVA